MINCLNIGFRHSATPSAWLGNIYMQGKFEGTSLDNVVDVASDGVEAAEPFTHHQEIHVAGCICASGKLKH